MQTPSGAVEIENLRVGDEVWGLDAAGKLNVNTVVATRFATVDGYLRMTFTDGATLEVTDVHPISTPEGWRPAGVLRPGDVVRKRRGLATIERIEKVSARAVVHDITVEPDACFYAGGILVHNKSRE